MTFISWREKTGYEYSFNTQSQSTKEKHYSTVKSIAKVP
jgi:hypothetical protein